MIRPYQPADWNRIWEILEPIFRAGTTYAYAPDITRADAYDAWIEKPMQTYVVEEDGKILGTYYIKPNQPGLGDHICNCGYAVSAQATGRGVAAAMCVHSQSTAVSKGFIGMQFNLVVSTNEIAIRLWKKHGFTIIGTIPFAFRHVDLGLVDAYVMFKSLTNAR